MFGQLGRRQLKSDPESESGETRVTVEESMRESENADIEPLQLNIPAMCELLADSDLKLEPVQVEDGTKDQGSFEHGNLGELDSPTVYRFLLDSALKLEPDHEDNELREESDNGSAIKTLANSEHENSPGNNEEFINLENENAWRGNVELKYLKTENERPGIFEQLSHLEHESLLERNEDSQFSGTESVWRYTLGAKSFEIARAVKHEEEMDDADEETSLGDEEEIHGKEKAAMMSDEESIVSLTETTQGREGQELHELETNHVDTVTEEEEGMSWRIEEAMRNSEDDSDVGRDSGEEAVEDLQEDLEMVCLEEVYNILWQQDFLLMPKLDKREAVAVGHDGDRQSAEAFTPPGDIPVSPLSLPSMTHSELVEVLPKLVAFIQQETLSLRRPDWWPHSVPWKQLSSGNTYKTTSPTSLRRAIQLCCTHLPQHTLQPSPAAQPRVIDWLNSHPPSRSCTQSAKACLGTINREHKGSTVPYLEIYLCYLCGDEFSSKDTLQKHQVQCCGINLSLSVPSTPPDSEAPSPGPPTNVSDDTASSGGATATTSLLSSPSSTLGFQDFVAGLDLVPVFRAKKIRQAQRRNTECETIDLEEPQTPISPSTPRTPKLLISQLSRDASANGGGGGEGNSSRRRLSYLRQSSEKRTEKVEGGEETGSESESDAESCSTSSDDTEDPKVRKKSLLNIDLTSGLGQRVMKHITSEVNVPVISDVEQFCRTPIKDKYQDRLRVRQLSYPITYKLTRKRLRQQQHCHMYKMTREHKEEFMEKMRTGLNKECRELLRTVRKCSVVVKRLSRKTLLKWKPSLNKISVSLKPLSAEEILFWTRPKPPVEASPSVFPTGPTFLYTDIDRVLGLKRKNGKPRGSCKLLAGHYVSEAANAELQLQKLTVYRSLLTDLSRATLNGDDYGVDGSSHHDAKPSATQDRHFKGHYGEKFPSLFSILSSGAPAKKATCSKQEVGKSREVVADFKQPLRIEIPSPTGAQHAASRSSLLDDTISIRTTTSSDEESNKGSVCCSMCALRNRCMCSPHRDASVLSRSSQSSQPVEQSTLSPEHTPPLPQLLSVCSTSKSPMSSHLTLSPPVLSPMSQVSGPSPASTPRLTRASASQSTFSSPVSQISGASAPSPSPCSSQRMAESPIPRPRRQVEAADAASPKSDRYGQKTVPGRHVHDQEDDIPRRPITRSNPIETVSDISDSVSTPQKRASSFSGSVLQSEDSRRESRLRHSASPGTLPKTDVRATRSGRVISETNGDSPGTGDVLSISGWHRGRSSRSGSRSSERSSTVSENASVDSAGLAGPVRMLRSGSSISSLSPKSDKSTGSSRIQVKEEKAAVFAGGDSDSAAGISPKSGGASPSPSNRSTESSGRLGTRSTSRGHMVHISSQSVRNNGKLVETSSCEPHSPASSSDLSGRTDVRFTPMKISPADSVEGFSSRSSSSSNPFLLSKAQNELFSSSIREQARRSWHTSHKSPDRGSSAKGILRSGNSFRTANMSLSPTPAAETMSDVWLADTIKSSLPSPQSSSKKKHMPTPVAPSPCTSPTATQPTSPARKRLSPLQMLSVLESAKSRRVTGKTGTGRLPWKHHKRGLSSHRLTGQRDAYPTRANNNGNPAKKMRLAP